MPTVETYGRPSAGLPQAQDARLRAARADDGGLGQSVQRLAGAISQYADNEAKVRADDLVLQADQRMRAVASGYKQQLGRNALDARGDTETALKTVYDEIMGANKDPLIRSYLQPALDRYQMLYSGQVQDHGLAQERVYNKEVGGARAANFAQNAVDNRDSPEVSSQFVASLRKQVAGNLALDGMNDPDIVSREVMKAESSIHAGIAEAYLAEGDVDAAHAYFEAHRDAMLDADETNISARLRGPLDKRQAYDDASMFMGANWSDQSGTASNYADPLRGMGKGVTDAYGKQRASGVHNGVDFAAPKGTPIHSIGSGKVVRSGYDDRSGHFIVVDHGDGSTSSYSHMEGATQLREGDIVTPDTMIGKVGSTGNSSGPHLHLVVKENGETVDPEKVIGEARQSPRRHNLAAQLARVDFVAEARGWSFERRERAKDEIRRRVSTDEMLQAREEDDAEREASEIVLGLGERFTDTSLIPGDLWGKMSPAARERYTNAARANVAPKAIEANGDTVTALEIMRIMEPEKFSQMRLGEYAHDMTRAELNQLRIDQAKLIATPPSQTDLRAKVAATIGTYADPADLGLDDKLEGKQRRIRIQRIMEEELRGVTGGKREPTDTELYQAFTRATGVALTFDKTFMGLRTGGQRNVRRFEVGVGDIPDGVETRIRAALKARIKREPTDEQVAEEYQLYKGRYW